jgi:phosphoribosylanthranilate isomerase
MKETANIAAVGALSPDFMGFIFFEKSPRFVGNEFTVPELLPRSCIRVGVFVNAAQDFILDCVNRNALQAIQLHGAESPELCMNLRKHGLQVIKVFSAGESIDFRQMEEYVPNVDYFLFDTKGKFHGGNAKAFDWSLLKAYPYRIPYFISGGIGPGNILKVLELQSEWLYGVDINSGVESSPGLKDVDKVKLIKKAILQDHAV